MRKKSEIGDEPRVLLVGYNGANNTGSEARLHTIIGEVRSALGPRTRITVPTLNEKNLRRYLKESEYLRIAPVPSIYFFALPRLVRQSDLVMLVEGSCYMDTWASPLLWAYLSVTREAHRNGIPSLAYAVDTGRLKPGNVKRVRRDASLTDLIITRTTISANRLRGWGVTAPIEVTDDNAFLFKAGGEDLISREWPEAKGRLAGLAVVDFHLWPVVVRPIGPSSRCYHWPYYFSSTQRKRRCSAELAASLARQADRLVDQYGKKIALIAMESVDTALAKAVKARMKGSSEARIFASDDYDAIQMTSLLRSLDLLVTSRYHASVLSMAAGVPTIGIGHDLRLHDLFQESFLQEEFFFRAEDPQLWDLLPSRIDRLVSEKDSLTDRFLEVHGRHLEAAKRNPILLNEFVKAKGLR